MKLRALFAIASMSILPVGECGAGEISGYELDEIRSALADWEDSIEKAPPEYNANTIRMLGEGVTKLSRKKSTFPKWRNDLFLAAQQKLLSIPGHAEYFAGEVERLRETALKWSPGNRGDYDRTRAWYLRDTLCHMPSPETVRVLGRYLQDERDTPYSLGGDAPSLPENAYLACAAFANMGLRIEPPLPDSGIHRWRHDVDEIRAWYAKVKSGEIPFSFKGQSVEYRFKPDGTWDTIPIANPPDDAPKVELPELPETKPEEQAPKEADVAHDKAPATNWYLVGGLVALLIAIAALAMRMMRKQ